ncbi:LysM peptidoglycan-binding domain-containing protein [Rossellomorea vietnamensis]|uniref:Autolysin n=2 Tax=Rossellomorea TaxID=2837508 RepID=A0A5D4KCI2_9BACI|nr:LysM peptidoglycan-binding domain-containing protein [Rossellomorea vietnamensis]TYR74375.1 LysM peptidoglycan-binding domain-containing protein [Rossellomorea vietnamensis]
MKKIVLLIFTVSFLLINLSPVQAQNNPRNIYEVKPGDYLWKIAQTYNMTVQDLKQINGLQTDLLLIGQKLRVSIDYKVVPGDTLWKLSQTFTSTVPLIKTANGLKSNTIYIGQKLKIPPKKLRMKGQFFLMTREEFKDWIFNQKFTRKVGKVQQHHTYQPSYQSFNGSNHFTLLQGMKDHHVTGMNWSDISQQLTTFPDGSVALGRPFNTPPEGSFGLLNEAVMHEIEKDAVAIENVGNFDAEHMTDEQRETIITVTALLMLKYDLQPTVDTITYHHWWDINTGKRVLDAGHGHAIKTCPGTGFFGGNSTDDAKNNFYPLVDRKMHEIWAAMQ